MAAAILSAASGCASPSASRLVANSQSGMQVVSAHLTAAQSDLAEAHNRLIGEPDPHQAGQELDAGRNELEQAITAGQLVRQDVLKLGESDINLQHQIDSHRNDWLGPRAKRLRDKLIVLAVLLTLGAALLRVGPLFGGPWGAAIVVAGNVLTAFVSPLIRFAWNVILRLANWLLAHLKKIGKTTVSATTGPGAPDATSGSD
jgi:hypothetical protein